MKQPSVLGLPKKFCWQMGLALFLLFGVYVLTTFLSMLSLTGDFNGKDRQTVQRLQEKLESLKAIPAGSKVDSGLVKLVKDTMRTDVILRDYEVNIDSLLPLVGDVDDTTKRNHSIDSLIENEFKKMLTFRESNPLQYPLNYFALWLCYSGTAWTYMCNNGPMGILTSVLVSPLLYLSIFALACWLVYAILVRYRKKLRTDCCTREIEKHLYPVRDWNSINFNAKEPEENHLGKGVCEFLRLKKPDQLTQKTFDMLWLEDEHETEDFARTTDFLTTWILRLGILGTLFGIMLAFYEVAKAVPLIRANEIPSDFKGRIREALTGHAVAVITALAAQTASIVFEIASLRWIGSSLGKDWLLKNKMLFLERSDVTAFDGDEFFGELRHALRETINEIKDLGSKFVESNKAVEKLPGQASEIVAKAGEAVKTLECINGKLHGIQSAAEKVKKDVEESGDILFRIKQLVQTIRLKIEFCNRKTQAKIDKLQDVLKSILTAIRKGIDKC